MLTNVDGLVGAMRMAITTMTLDIFSREAGFRSRGRDADQSRPTFGGSVAIQLLLPYASISIGVFRDEDGQECCHRILVGSN
jgi:hypothetical protein